MSIDNKTKILNVIEIIATIASLIFLIYYSMMNYAGNVNTESRIGDQEFNDRERRLYFLRETIAILMIIFVSWRLFRPNKFLKIVNRWIVNLLIITLSIAIIFDFSYKLFKIF
jgi:magnesium-transporting ATPase (P-type)